MYLEPIVSIPSLCQTVKGEKYSSTKVPRTKVSTLPLAFGQTVRREKYP